MMGSLFHGAPVFGLYGKVLHIHVTAYLIFVIHCWQCNWFAWCIDLIKFSWFFL